MCGIVGYVGKRPAVPVLIDGLHRLEYRGYDSAGLAVNGADGLWLRRAVGPVSVLEGLVSADSPTQTTGIAHTRWATHGRVSIENAHPHTDMTESIAVVHNGVIENSEELKAELIDHGITFKSETDTEVIAHLIAYFIEKGPLEAFKGALRKLTGTYGVAVVFKGVPDTVFVARLGSPIVLGVGKGETIIASDPQAIINHTTQAIYLNDGEIAVISAEAVQLTKFDGAAIAPAIEMLDSDHIAVTKGSFPHFLLKEISEQPEAVARCLAGRLQVETGEVVLGGLNLPPHDRVGIKSVVPIGCGTGYHAAQITAFAVEELSGISSRAELAVDLASRRVVVSPESLYLAFSQSGETADVIGVARELLLKGANVAGIVNVVGSSLPRLLGKGVYVHAGPEIAVASTKAFCGQITAGVLIAMLLGRSRVLSSADVARFAAELAAIPSKMRDYLRSPGPVKEIAQELTSARYVLFIGRGFSYPIALEGALKFKEECYIPSTGYHAGEMKHGPIAMIEADTPVVVIIPRDRQRERTLVNLQEAKARGAKIVAIHTRGDKSVREICDWAVEVPETAEHLSPLLTSLPLQLIAYHAAVHVGADVDRPRNLAKSVTVA